MERGEQAEAGSEMKEASSGACIQPSSRGEALGAEHGPGAEQDASSSQKPPKNGELQRLAPLPAPLPGMEAAQPLLKLARSYSSCCRRPGSVLASALISPERVSVKTGWVF